LLQEKKKEIATGLRREKGKRIWAVGFDFESKRFKNSNKGFKSFQKSEFELWFKNKI
jgi:hypothetical protein